MCTSAPKAPAPPVIPPPPPAPDNKLQALPLTLASPSNQNKNHATVQSFRQDLTIPMGNGYSNNLNIPL